MVLDKQRAKSRLMRGDKNRLRPDEVRRLLRRAEGGISTSDVRRFSNQTGASIATVRSALAKVGIHVNECSETKPEIPKPTTMRVKRPTISRPTAPKNPAKVLDEERARLSLEQETLRKARATLEHREKLLAQREEDPQTVQEARDIAASAWQRAEAAERDKDEALRRVAELERYIETLKAAPSRERAPSGMEVL